MRALALLSAASVLALMAAAPPAAAQRDPCAGTLSPARMVECLRPGGIDPTARGIRPAAPAAAPRAVAPAAGAPAGAPPSRALDTAAPPVPASSVDLSVPFAFDSAELTPQGVAALAALATALKNPALASARFRIAGHTDATGTDEYNQALSERRAEAARRYLVERGGVDAARLAAVGFGRTQLYDPAKPNAPSNRRVQVIRLEN